MFEHLNMILRLSGKYGFALVVLFSCSSGILHIYGTKETLNLQLSLIS